MTRYPEQERLRHSPCLDPRFPLLPRSADRHTVMPISAQHMTGEARRCFIPLPLWASSMGSRRTPIGADKGYHCRDFILRLRHR
jgi:hypothetical protein